jgi:hypothetical protein
VSDTFLFCPNFTFPYTYECIVCISKSEMCCLQQLHAFRVTLNYYACLSTTQDWDKCFCGWQIVFGCVLCWDVINQKCEFMSPLKANCCVAQRANNVNVCHFVPISNNGRHILETVAPFFLMTAASNKRQ